MRTALLVLTFACMALPLAGQRSALPAAQRPDLPKGADVNDPQAYYNLGVSLLGREPSKAADAFGWAARLEPSWAEPLYARRVALLMSRPTLLDRYMQGERRSRPSAEMLSLDSLLLRAQMMSPFLQRKHDKQMFMYYVQKSAEAEARRNGEERPDPVLVSFHVESYLRGTQYNRAWVAYSERRFADALRDYATALRGAREKSWIHAERGRIFFHMGQYDSAQASLKQALTDWRDRDDEKLVRFYESKALMEQSIGLIQEQLGNAAAAREAYSRALQEDLSYAPAHQRLAELALASGDTATALNEMELAAQAAAGDPAVHLAYGYLLARTGRLDEAMVQLTRATTVEPMFAKPYIVLASIADMQGKPEVAAGFYRSFVQRSASADPNRAQAQARLAELDPSAAPTP